MEDPWEPVARRRVGLSSPHTTGAGSRMKKSAIALGVAASLGLAATIGVAKVPPGSDVPADVVHGVVAGVILGSRVWPYEWNAPHADSRSRLQLLSVVCRWQGQCAGYGVAAAALSEENRGTDGRGER